MKRPRLQFSLRSLMIFTAICAFASAWLASKIEQKRKEREVVEAINKSGGRAGYDYQIHGATPPGPDWLRKLLGENFFSEVEHVGFNFSGNSVTDAELENLKPLTHLQRLEIWKAAKITDAGLEHLKELTKVQRLDLLGSKVTDSGLIYLSGLTELQRLDLSETKVGDAGLEHLKGLTKLQRLELLGTIITDAGLVHIKGMSQLQLVNVAQTKVTDTGIRELHTALPNCQIDH